MCDFCGCRRQRAVDELSEEHERLLDLVYGMRRAASGGAFETVVETLETRIAPLLRQHTGKEERGLFLQLRAAWEADDRLDTLVEEHREIEDLVDAVLAGGRDWQAAVGALANALSEHIFDEETDLFPYALYELGDRQWAEVERIHELARASAPAPPAATLLFG